MRAGDLCIENFPPGLKEDGKIAAIRSGRTFRQFVIDAVAAQVAAEAAGAPREQGPGRTAASRDSRAS